MTRRDRHGREGEAPSRERDAPPGKSDAPPGKSDAPSADPRRRWETRYAEQVERRETFETSSAPLRPLYSESNLAPDLPARLGFPGEPPFTRGIQPNMYRGRLWTMRQYAGFGTAQETNRRFRYLLDQGQTGLSVAFDLPTQMGYDSDAPLAEGEVGRVGVPIDTLDDMETLFDRIPLDQVSTSMTINATAAILLAMVQAVAEKQGIAPASLNGTVQNDLLKEYVARGTYIYPPEASMRLVTDIIAYCAETIPRWNPISISGYHIREAGATAAQELGFTFSHAIAYVDAARRRGLDVDVFGPRLSFFFNAHSQLLEEVAKFRAARRMWAAIMRERFGAKSERSLMLRFHTQTAGSTLTYQQPLNNAVRTTLQALAAVLGGTQSLHTNAYDEAIGLPAEESALLALRTQQILAEESGVADTIDPLGGSYAIEALTDDLERHAREIIVRIDAMGGAIEAIRRGVIQEEIHKSAYAHHRAVEAGRRRVVGVNCYRQEEPPVEAFHVDPTLEREQKDRLRKVKAGRDAAAVERSLARLRDAAGAGPNLVPPILDCVRAYATVGEISDAMREVFGVYEEPRLF
jgi:methylmalonyl-CoA mutase N-terminal domain/subunit